MAQNKYYIKAFLTDDDEKYVVNYNGAYTDATGNREELCSGLGNDIVSEMDRMLLEESVERIYGFRIDYTLTPIKTDPFV